MTNHEISKLEERLQHLLVQFQVEAGVLDRMVYKNKNQHRRSSYFQYLLKVRRDVKLLQSAGLGEILKVLFPIINGRRAAQKAFYPTRSKSNSSGSKHNCQDRLLGVARLLSKMTEPILRAATQISLLLAKSFFTGFCITILSLLARLRVLVQQMLLDVILIYNKVSSLSQERQSVKLFQDGIEAFREYYPSTERVLMLDCVWREDKFFLVEKTENRNIENRNEDLSAVPFTTSVQYETFELFDEATKHENICSPTMETDTHPPKDQPETVAIIGNTVNSEDARTLEAVKFASADAEEVLAAKVDTFLSATTPEPQTKSRRNVAFVPVKRSNPSDTNTSGPSKKMKLDLVSSNSTEAEDPFLDLLFSGRVESSVL
ncbi:uncharacterized protein LOC103986445 [Musa acuminata AAA Group]|uniref:(wild Malaysian banana) hypothetical protein n=1 Tax=Musa acuminata subsp. malaccensis TaxID=214687 RepID=A0A804J966_MUSAM|nr:PREDICTED: uncharacterized protein LOC103986445 [Musa acuminata subsp. malaccensis]XP_009402743.1 PREDICTED: uncharacterized protein LOC103986445 [Musa acuminata subsp. malaccensis]XP_018681395.1 PREDICTED: uncharacterized protein LOC103986445 [Musa acuminata subsp. malaccensis]XP_018681396.1 PREDICTED: uncharacterized protein LOC103986445 [Musa acuminata subsp. malaccensis]CAG1839994.1 unnamed protein product [Musa acuminata subsp. malaccensis]